MVPFPYLVYPDSTKVIMSIRSFFTSLFGDRTTGPGAGLDINPATGLPMLDGAVDIAGNPYGIRRDRVADETSSMSCSGPELRHDDHRSIGSLDQSGSSIGNDWSI